MVFYLIDFQSYKYKNKVEWYLSLVFLVPNPSYIYYIVIIIVSTIVNWLHTSCRRIFQANNVTIVDTGFRYQSIIDRHKINKNHMSYEHECP